jgi:hypothetical protein
MFMLSTSAHDTIINVPNEIHMKRINNFMIISLRLAIVRSDWRDYFGKYEKKVGCPLLVSYWSDLYSDISLNGTSGNDTATTTTSPSLHAN